MLHVILMVYTLEIKRTIIVFFYCLSLTHTQLNTYSFTFTLSLSLLHSGFFSDCFFLEGLDITLILCDKKVPVSLPSPNNTYSEHRVSLGNIYNNNMLPCSEVGSAFVYPHQRCKEFLQYKNSKGKRAGTKLK